MSPMPPAVEAALERARLAPSAHNAQPWCLDWTNDHLTVSLDSSRALVDGDPTGRQNTLSVGVLLGYLQLAAAEQGLGANIELWQPGSQRLAKINFDAADDTGADASLASHLSARRTVRGPYEPDLPEGTVPALERAVAQIAEVTLTVLQDERRKSVAALVGQGTGAALSLPAMRRELATLVHVEEGQPRGMSVAGMRLQASAAIRTGAEAIDQMDASREAQEFESWYSSTPAILVLSTAFDGREAWLRTGMAAARLLVTAASLGLAHCIAAAPVEVPFLVPQLRGLLGTSERPQMVVRVGVPSDPRGEPTGRLELKPLMA